MENWSTRLSRSVSARAKVLPPSFYERKTLVVAKELLGKILVVRHSRGFLAARIVETEAYSGEDPASHSAHGETPRSSVMFGPPGRAYVYFIYGMYEMLNFVTESKGTPGAVLIRAVEPIFGEELMRKRRGRPNRRALTSGPGKLTQALGIRRTHNKQPLQGPNLFVLGDGTKPEIIAASRRVGISQATDLEWRFSLPDNPFVSRVKENKGARHVQS